MVIANYFSGVRAGCPLSRLKEVVKPSPPLIEYYQIVDRGSNYRFRPNDRYYPGFSWRSSKWCPARAPGNGYRGRRYPLDLEADWRCVLKVGWLSLNRVGHSLSSNGPLVYLQRHGRQSSGRTFCATIPKGAPAPIGLFVSSAVLDHKASNTLPEPPHTSRFHRGVSPAWAGLRLPSLERR